MLKQITLLAAGLLTSALAQAHDGHGLSGAHWHATDSLGFVIAALAAAAGWWLVRRK